MLSPLDITDLTWNSLEAGAMLLKMKKKKKKTFAAREGNDFLVLTEKS